MSSPELFANEVNGPSSCHQREVPIFSTGSMFITNDITDRSSIFIVYILLWSHRPLWLALRWLYTTPCFHAVYNSLSMNEPRGQRLFRNPSTTNNGWRRAQRPAATTITVCNPWVSYAPRRSRMTAKPWPEPPTMAVASLGDTRHNIWIWIR